MAWPAPRTRVAGELRPFSFWAEGKSPRDHRLNDIACKLGISREELDRMTVGEDPSLTVEIPRDRDEDERLISYVQRSEKSRRNIVIEVPAARLGVSSEAPRLADEPPIAELTPLIPSGSVVFPPSISQGPPPSDLLRAMDLQHKIDNILDMSTWWMPQRVVKEIIGDFQEDIHRRILAGQRVCVWGETVMTLFWLTTNTIGYFLKAVGIRKAG